MKPQFAPEIAAPIDPYYASLSTLVTRAERNRAEMSRLHAERAEVCAAAIDLVAERVLQRAAARGRGAHSAIGDDIPLREAISELGAALRVGDRTIQTWLGDGDALVRRYRGTLDALRDGRIDERHASAIVDAGTGLDDSHVAEFERLTLRAADEMTGAGMRETARVIAARLQPDLVESRQRAAHERRRVRTYAVEDGVARLLVDGPAALVRAMFDRLTTVATALAESGDAAAAPDAPGTPAADAPASAPEGDTRCLDERRFDLLAELVLTGAPSGADRRALLGEVRGQVQVTVPVLTLMGVGDEPAVLAGHGPIDAETARRLAATAPGWDRILTHPITGEPLAVDRYSPSAAMRRYLVARDGGCRWPMCRCRPGRCDADHTQAYSEGGKTAVDNLTLFNRRHHVMKHASPWRIRHLGGGSLEFTSPTGRVYANTAPAVLTHVAPRWLEQTWQTPPDPADPAPF